MSSRRSVQYFPHAGRTLTCRFCKEEGHDVKICRKLANILCKYCKNRGHTTRRCPTLASKEERRRNKARLNRSTQFSPDKDGFSKSKSSFRRRVNKGPVATFNLLNNFSSLCDDSETESTKKKFVTIVRPTLAQARPTAGAWSKPLSVKEALVASQEEKRAEEPKRVPKRVPKSVPKSVPKKQRWADICDEESDSDDEYLF